MKKIISTLVIIALVAIGIYFFIPHSNGIDSVVTPSTSSSPVLHLASKNISLTVVDTDETRELGLGGRVSLPEDEAMLFVFETPDIYEFWMKDMKFAIDIIWLDNDFNVVHIASNATPESYPDTTFSPESESLYVLETNAGFAEKNAIKVGTKLNIDLKK